MKPRRKNQWLLTGISWTGMVIIIVVMIIPMLAMGTIFAIGVLLSTPFAVFQWIQADGNPGPLDLSYDHPVRKVLERLFPVVEDENAKLR